MSYERNNSEEKCFINSNGFYYDGIHKSGKYYDKLDRDFFGYDRVFIQHFLMHFREFLNLPILSLNVYSLVFFNENLEDYLDDNELYLEDLIRNSIYKKRKFNENYKSILLKVYDVNLEKIKKLIIK